MSTVVVTDIRRTGETASRSTRGIAAAWLSMNGTGTIAVRDSQNVSSLVDNETGDYTENFTSATADSEYSISGWTPYVGASTAGLLTGDPAVAPTTGSFRFRTGDSATGVANDFNRPCVTIMGDLA